MSRPHKPLVNTEELGRSIRRKREQLGLSLRDVANETDVSASTLSRIENGTGKPDADNIARLTAWLDVPMERILGGRHSESERRMRWSTIRRNRRPRSLRPTSGLTEIYLRKLPPLYQNYSALPTSSSAPQKSRLRKGVNLPVCSQSSIIAAC